MAKMCILSYTLYTSVPSSAVFTEVHDNDCNDVMAIYDCINSTWPTVT